MEEKKGAKKLYIYIYEIAILLAAYYLTYQIDLITIETTFQYCFVFLYFVIALNFVIYYRHKIFIDISFPTWRIIAGVLVFFLLFFTTSLIPKVQENTVSIEATSNAEGECREVWLLRVSIDDKDLPLDNLNIVEDYGWEYHDAYVFYPKTDGTNNRLTFKIAAAKMKLIFAKNAWSGQTSISVNGDTIANILLRVEDETNIEVEQAFILPEPSFLTKAILSVGAFLVIFYVVDTIILLFQKRKMKR